MHRRSDEGDVFGQLNQKKGRGVVEPVEERPANLKIEVEIEAGEGERCLKCLPETNNDALYPPENYGACGVDCMACFAVGLAVQVLWVAVGIALTVTTWILFSCHRGPIES